MIGGDGAFLPTGRYVAHAVLLGRQLLDAGDAIDAEPVALIECPPEQQPELSCEQAAFFEYRYRAGYTSVRRASLRRRCSRESHR